MSRQSAQCILMVFICCAAPWYAASAAAPLTPPTQVLTLASANSQESPSASPAPVSSIQDSAIVPSPLAPTSDQPPVETDIPSPQFATDPFPGATGEALLWSTSTATGSVDAFRQGYGSNEWLAGPGGISAQGLSMAGIRMGGYQTNDPNAALPYGFSAGLQWQGGRASWGDFTSELGSGLGSTMRTLTGATLNAIAGPGVLTIGGGIARLTPRQALIPGTGSVGPYWIGSDSPILPETVVVRVDGTQIPATDYTIDPAAGSLSFHTQAPSALSLIDVRYEEALSESATGDRVVGCSYSLDSGTQSNVRAGIISDSTTPSGPESATVTEGPFYSTGAPLAITLTHGAVVAVNSVTVDGAPLRAIDFVAMPAARVVFIRRVLPAGAMVDVTYQYQGTASTNPSGTTIDLDGVQQTNSKSQVRWSLASNGAGHALDVAAGSAILSNRLQFGLEVRHDTDSFESAPGLNNQQRVSGTGAGCTFRPDPSTTLGITVLDATAPVQNPFTDSSGSGDTAGIHLDGIHITGAFTAQSSSTTRWDAGEYLANGRRLQREQLSTDVRHERWSISLSIAHRSIAATSQVTQPDAAFGPGALNDFGVDMGFRAQPAPGITTYLNGAAHVLNQATGQTNPKSARASVAWIPHPGLTVDTGYEVTMAPPSLADPGSATAAGLAFAAAETFSPAAATAAQSNVEPALTANANGAPAPGINGSAAASLQPQMTPFALPGSAAPGFVGTGVGMRSRAAPGTNALLAGLAQQPEASRTQSLSVTWQARPDLSIGLEEENSTIIPWTDVMEQWQEVGIHLRSAAPGARSWSPRAEVQIGECAAVAGAGGFGAATPFAKASFTINPIHAWTLRTTGSASGSSGWTIPQALSTLSSLNGASGTISVSVSLARSLGEGRSAFIDWQKHLAAGAGGFSSDAVSIGATSHLFASFGIRIQGQHSWLSTDNGTSVDYSGTTYSVGLVNML